VVQDIKKVAAAAAVAGLLLVVVVVVVVQDKEVGGCHFTVTTHRVWQGRWWKSSAAAGGPPPLLTLTNLPPQWQSFGNTSSLPSRSRQPGNVAPLSRQNPNDIFLLQTNAVSASNNSPHSIPALSA
jgi:hypothetical protein